MANGGMDLTIQAKKRGQKRFRTGIEFQKEVHNLARTLQDRFLRNLASNYPKDKNTNLSETYRAVAEEIARLQFSLSEINDDRTHELTRAEYLYQILGDSLFLGEKSINEDLADTEYRDFLLKVRNAYFGGSRKDNIESSVSEIIGLPVTLRELYLELRKKDTAFKITDTHKMFFDIFMDNVEASSDLGRLLDDLRFFINLIKPAHTIYDTRLIWTEKFTNRDGNCDREYDWQDMDENVYGTTCLYMITYQLQSMYKVVDDDPEATWETGVISSIDTTNGYIKLTSGRVLTYTSDTEYFTIDGLGAETTATLEDFSIGDEVKYYADRDSSENTSVIKDDWSFEGIVADIDESVETITLDDGSTLVYNEDVLIYTRDTNGVFRILIENLEIGREVIFKAMEFTKAFKFFNVPTEVQENYYKQFDEAVIRKPFFQKNVRKVFEVRDDLEEGYHVIEENGVAKVIKINGRFYKLKDTESWKEFSIFRFSLFIGGEFVRQLSYEEPSPVPDLETAVTLFVEIYGHTEILDTSTNWEIKVTKTARLNETDKNAILQTTQGKTQFCDRDAECFLLPYYEDTRRYCVWPDLVLTSGFFCTVDLIPIENAEGEHNVPGYFKISSDPNNYVMALLPMFAKDGSLASPGDLIVYVNGVKVENSVEAVDPWTGEVYLNFLPPSNSCIRIDYYYAKRMPDPQSYMEEFKTEVETTPPDMGAEFTVVEEGGIVKRLHWPFEMSDPSMYGDLRDYQVNKYPILTRDGILAGVEDITVSSGSTISNGILQATEGSDLATITDGDVSSVEEGDTIIIEARNYLDNTLIYSVEEVVSSTVIRLSKPFPFTFDEDGLYDYKIIRFTVVDDAVEAVRPLLGHVKINFLPPVGTIVKFDYYFTHLERNYQFVPDFPEYSSRTDAPYWVYEGSGHLVDVRYGSKYGYQFVVDQGITGFGGNVITFDEIKKTGYKYATQSLAGSSVLNSPDTLLLNEYQREGSRSSFKNVGHKLNHYDTQYSPEHLTDTDKTVVLGDKYLNKDQPAVTQLYDPTPPFIMSFTDKGNHRASILPEGEDTYEDPDINHHDLKGSFSIIDPDESGVIDYNPICEYETNKRINLYADLRLKKEDNGGYDAHLSSLCEGSRTIPFDFLMVDQYYPNRELRLNDYLDYINHIPLDIIEGIAATHKGSKVIKSINRNWLQLRRGDKLTFKNVPLEQSDGGIIFGEVIYTVIDVMDPETVEIHSRFREPSGSYDYEVIRNVVYNVDVNLNEVTRNIVFKKDNPFKYGFEDSYLDHFPNYAVGDTGLGFQLSFPDPDTDPYPRNPDNPNITGLPSGPVPLSSEVIRADGTSIYYPSPGSSSGYTGPSGAVDLGLTGPTSDANPKILDDTKKYLIPSGDTGIYASYSEPEYRVQWRNWDQDIIIVNLGGDTGVIIEDPYNLVDDIGDGIRRSYWDVNEYLTNGYANALKHVFYHGSVIESSEVAPEGTVNTVDYLDGRIVLDAEQAMTIDNLINSVPPIDPATQISGLGEATYVLKRRVIREVLHDNSIKVSEIREFD